MLLNLSRMSLTSSLDRNAERGGTQVSNLTVEKNAQNLALTSTLIKFHGYSRKTWKEKDNLQVGRSIKATSPPRWRRKKVSEGWLPLYTAEKWCHSSTREKDRWFRPIYARPLSWYSILNSRRETIFSQEWTFLSLNGRKIAMAMKKPPPTQRFLEIWVLLRSTRHEWREQ